MSPQQPKLNISPEETRQTYQLGVDAVVALVERLQEHITNLETRIQVLENQTAKDSHNSSKPPSSDGYSKRTKSQRSKSKRSSGGQFGHPGSTLPWSEIVDEVVTH